MDQHAFQADLARLRHNPWILALSGIAPLLLVAAIWFALPSSRFKASALTGSGLLWYQMMRLAWQKNPRPITQPARVRVDASGVHVGNLFVPRSQLRDAVVKSVGSRSRLVLDRGDLMPSIELESTNEEARDLLRVLRSDAVHKVLEFQTLSPLVASGHTVTVLLLLCALLLGGAVLALQHSLIGMLAVAILSVISVAMVILAGLPRRVRIGADGLEILGRGTPRFLAYGQIATVERYGGGSDGPAHTGLRIRLASGEEILVPVEVRKAEQTAAIHERIVEAMEAMRRGDVAIDEGALLRGERSVPEWVKALRGIGEGAATTFRVAPVPTDRLMRVVEDTSQTAQVRAAAAVALGGALDEEGRGRLRAAAAATEAPKLRVAIEKVADGARDADIEAALSEVDVEASSG
jgi:hypothetical protein